MNDRYNIMSNFLNYSGWELSFFDNADNFRNYQIDIIKNNLKGVVAEIGPGNGSLCEKYRIYCDCLLYTSPSPRDGLLARMPAAG